jgi:large subunit ribosomal protein L25
MLHQGVRVRDIATNPKWKAVTEGEAMLVHVIMPKAEEVAAPADAAAVATATPAEPEVIKKGKKEEDEEAKDEKKDDKKKDEKKKDEKKK